MFDFKSVCPDGVRCNNKWILEQLYNFLCLKSHYVGSLDTNQNAKNAKYQLFGASSAVWVEHTILDPTLCLMRVAHALLQVKDFVQSCIS